MLPDLHFRPINPTKRLDMNRILCLLVSFLLFPSLWAQELRCSILLTNQQVQGTNRQVFQTLQNAMNEFLNNKSWSGYKFNTIERIECNMLFNITDYSGDRFKGTLQVQVRRPVYNSSYNTVLLNYTDNDIEFTYVEFEPLEFSETSHLSNLTSLLAYYAYMILGFDFDSFGLKSGTEFFQKAEKVVLNAQNAPERGWRSGESTSRRNRYWLINNILNEDFSPARTFFFEYHRLGMDVMYDRIAEGRIAIAESLNLLQELYRNRPDPFMHFFQVILDAKSDEFVNIFQGSPEDEKRRVVALLNQIDPNHSDKYRLILGATQ
jgi:hypothetical protein